MFDWIPTLIKSPDLHPGAISSEKFGIRSLRAFESNISPARNKHPTTTHAENSMGIASEED